MSRPNSPASTKEYQELNRKLQTCHEHLEVERAVNQSLRENQGDRKQQETTWLSRSSIEAYGGMAIGLTLSLYPMTWWLRMVFFGVLTFLCGDFVWRFPLKYRWWKQFRFLPLCIIVLLVGWAGEKNVAQAYKLAKIPPVEDYMLSYGTIDPTLKVTLSPFTFHGQPGSMVVVAGYLLSKYADDYYLVAACFHNAIGADYADVNGISKSKPFDIRNWEIQMPIEWNVGFKEELSEGKHGSNYVLLMVPKRVSVDSFDSVRQATDQGAYVLATGAQPSGF